MKKDGKTALTTPKIKLQNDKKAEVLYNSAKKMADCIPFGQPILVGHHSEGRDRNFRKRIHNTFGKSFQAQDKAKHYEQKAAAIENNRAIFSDDPQAIQKTDNAKAILYTLMQMAYGQGFHLDGIAEYERLRCLMEEN